MLRPGATAQEVAEFVAAQTPSPVLWQDVETFRRLWPGKLVLKGVMHPDDATRAAAMGVDGIMVSNHGARQLDRAPSPVEVLPAIHAAVGDKMTVMYDSGIRRGSDVIVALCLGAKFVFVGRHTLYGVAAGGVPAPRGRSASSATKSIAPWRRWARPISRAWAPVPDVEGSGRPQAQRAAVACRSQTASPRRIRLTALPGPAPR